MAGEKELTNVMDAPIVKGLGLKKEKLEMVARGIREGEVIDETDLAIAFDMNPAELGWNFRALERLLKTLRKTSC